MKWRNDIENWLQWAGDQRVSLHDEAGMNFLEDVLELEDALNWFDYMTRRGMAQPDRFGGRYS